MNRQLEMQWGEYSEIPAWVSEDYYDKMGRYGAISTCPLCNLTTFMSSNLWKNHKCLKPPYEFGSNKHCLLGCGGYQNAFQSTGYGLCFACYNSFLKKNEIPQNLKQ